MIQFDLWRLPTLYSFKTQTIQLCLNFIKDVIKGSSKSKHRGLHQKLNDIETDLYDIFCRWCFNAIRYHEFDHTTFLPTGNFIQMEDLAYYLKRFNIELSDSFITFPMDQFQKIKNRASIIQQEANIPALPHCSDVQIERLRYVYQGNDFDNDVQKLISRYVYLGGLNNSLSTPPAVLSLFPSHEMFGTPLNTCCPSFCSPFEDEKIFSSNGSFFKFNEYKEDVVYFANPPFDDIFCSQMTDKLLDDLSKHSISLVVIIPVWDTDQQKKYQLKDFGLPFDAYNRLVNSPYFQSEIFLSKGKYPFFNYFYNKMVHISNTHIINLGKPVDLLALQKVWQSLTKK